MGSNTGQDNERPLHRVWVDAFRLAAHQITNREYEHFLRATASQSPPQWNDPNFNHPEQPVVAVSWFDAMKYCEWLSTATSRIITCPPKLNGSEPPAASWKANFFPGVTLPQNHYPTTKRAGSQAQNWLAGIRQMHSVSTTFRKMSMSGAVIGTRPTTTPFLPNETHAVPKPASAVLLAEVRGAITSKSHVAPLAPVFRQNFTMQTMASGWPAILTCAADNRVPHRPGQYTVQRCLLDHCCRWRRY